MAEHIWTVLEAIVPSLLVGVVMAFWSRQQNKKNKAADDREANTRKKDALQIALLVATAELSYAQVMALKRGSPNGEVEVALDRYNKAMEKFRDFERQQLGYID